MRCPHDRVPLVPTIENINTDTILLDAPTGYASLNMIHEVTNTAVTRQHIDASMKAPPRPENLQNVYELPSIGHTIRYLHAAAGYPVKATWLRKAIRNGNYNT